MGARDLGCGAKPRSAVSPDGVESGSALSCGAPDRQGDLVVEAFERTDEVTGAAPLVDALRGDV